MYYKSLVLKGERLISKLNDHTLFIASELTVNCIFTVLWCGCSESHSLVGRAKRVI